MVLLVDMKDCSYYYLKKVLFPSAFYLVYVTIIPVYYKLLVYLLRERKN